VREDIGDLPVGQPHYRKEQPKLWSKQIIGPILLRRGLQSNDEALATPEFYIVKVDKAHGLRNRFGIVGANQRLKSHEMPVVPNDVSPILCHPRVPTGRQTSYRL
jgi:hypothetical protein